MAEPDVLDLLPEVIRSTARPGTPLAALGAAAGDMHGPVAAVLDRLDSVVDPFRAPGGFVRYLAGWVDLGWVAVADDEAGAHDGAAMTVHRLRDVIGASAELSARRGTPAGLARFLHLATGVEGFEVEDVPGAFHVRVRAPERAVDQLELVRLLVTALRPAHVTSEVVLVGQDRSASRAGDPAPPPPPPPPRPAGPTIDGGRGAAPRVAPV